MSDVDFSTLLAMKADDVKPPPTLPTGTYNGVIESHTFGKSREKQTDFVAFNLRVLSAGDDVEKSELGDIDLSQKKFTANFYITPNSFFRLTDFIKSCGIRTEGRSVAELIPEVVGKEVLIPVVKAPDRRDVTKTRNELGDITGIGR
jgi:hypothetical protein